MDAIVAGLKIWARRTELKTGDVRVISPLNCAPMLVKISYMDPFSTSPAYLYGKCVLTNQSMSHQINDLDNLSAIGPALNEMEIIAWAAGL